MTSAISGTETLTPESLGVLTRRLLVEVEPLEALDRRHQTSGALLVEQYAGAVRRAPTRLHRRRRRRSPARRPPGPRRARSRSPPRQGTAARVRRSSSSSRSSSETRPRNSPRSPRAAARIASSARPSPATFRGLPTLGARGHGEVNALVGDDPPEHEIEVLSRVCQRQEMLDVHRRMHDLGGAAVVAFDARGDVTGVCHEHIRSARTLRGPAGATDSAGGEAAAASLAPPPRPPEIPPPRRSASACGSSRRAMCLASVRTFFAHAWLLESTRSKPERSNERNALSISGSSFG